ncbi:MAG: Hsp70 family protein [Paracoccaceae bacterium]|jgi:hypothetical chaperone protein
MVNDQHNMLGIDFGTSNSAVATLVDGKVRRLAMEQGSDTLPTAIFFDFARDEIHIGTKANTCLTDGAEGRYMRSLKRVLGTSLMREKRYFMGQHLDFLDIIAGFLAQLKSRAEAVEGRIFDRVLSGRPVHFHDDPVKDKQAEIDLRECYTRAGFNHVEFMFEPEAAALANNVLDRAKSLGLIVDIGGGTSDFSIFRAIPNAATPVQFLATHGERLGGTDFDKTLNVRHFMPLLGKDAPLRRDFGSGTATAPVSLFNDLATWEKIPFMYSADIRRLARDLQRHALNRAPFKRLLQVLEFELGHELSMLAESAKIAANRSLAAPSIVDLGLIEKDASIAISHAALNQMMTPHSTKIVDGINKTLSMSRCCADDITDVVFVGGSSLMEFVNNASTEAFPNATFHTSAVFTAVVDGLALAAKP